MTTYYSPSQNDGKHIFVFGSNLAGRHGAGAAWDAAKHWGAVEGEGRGRTGQSYAIPTKDERLFVRPIGGITFDIAEFIRYAKANPELTFLVTAIGCGFARFTHETMAPLFYGVPGNCVLPHEWKPVHDKLYYRF